MPRLLILVLLLGGCDAAQPTAADPVDAAVSPMDAARPPPAPLVPAPAATARLTQAQYAHVIADVFGDDIVVPGPLEPDVALDGLWAIGAARTTISPRGVELYEAAAYAIAEQVLGDPARRRRVLACEPGPQDTACLGQVIAKLGRRLWRRPLTESELSGLVALALDAENTLGDPRQGLTFALAALLQSPWFLLRPVTPDMAPAGEAVVLDGWAWANRVAFFLWDSGPDEGLLAAAEAGALDLPASRAAWVTHLLDDPRARRGMRAFFNDYLKLRELDGLFKDPQVFTRYTPELGPMAREETLATLEHLVFDAQADYRAAFTGHTTFLNRKLAAIYGVPAPAAAGFARTELPADGPRAGLLGQASILAQNAHPVSSSATLRGRFIRETLLCGVIPPPPADVDTSLPEPNADLPTLRDRVAIHMTGPSCAGCHQIMDPIGLGLENFDGIGRYRTLENGALIDASGVLDGQAFEDALALGEAVAAHPQLAPCLTRKLYSYAVGHAPTAGEAGELARLEATFEQKGYQIKALLAAIALSPGFGTIAPPAEEE